LTPHLFTPLRLRGLELRNRIVVSPMCQYSAVEGQVQDWHFRHHARFALSGVGAAFVEATGVTRDGRITHGCTGLWDDAQIAGLARIAAMYREHGVTPGIQLAHAGRRASAALPWEGAKPLALGGPGPAWPTVGPSALPERDGYPAPRELTVREIEGLVEDFRAAAGRAARAGFDIVEIHGAHGYLLHSFFSPIANRREDAFGGSLERRMRLPLLVAETVRAAWPAELPVFYRVSAVDGVEGGVTIEDTVALAQALKKRGVDVIDCSSGGISGPATLSTRKIREGYQVPYAEAVRHGAGIATMAVGAIISPALAESILAEGRADLIALGRELMADPNWPYRAARELGLERPWQVLPEKFAFYLERRAAVLED
jgi:2,4-dienoyl-CoA reductase-like NADH-dependent reductase (Old Yellow Enzyme family)